jgi:hypothetical protein
MTFFFQLSSFSYIKKYPGSEVIGTRLAYGRYRKPVIIVCKVINMDIFSHKTTSLHFRRPLLTHWSHMDYTFMMDGCNFLAFKISFTPIIKLGRARIFLNITPIVF